MQGKYRRGFLANFKKPTQFKVHIRLFKRERAFRTQIGQSTFFVLPILCYRWYGQHARAFCTQIGRYYYFFLDQFGYGKHARAFRTQIGLNKKSLHCHVNN